MVQGQWDTYQTRNDRENKVRADAQKEVDKEAVRVLKNLQKEQAREIERKRKASLTKAQLVEENKRKKQESSRKKLGKEKQHAEKLENSRRILGLL